MSIHPTTFLMMRTPEAHAKMRCVRDVFERLSAGGSPEMVKMLVRAIELHNVSHHYYVNTLEWYEIRTQILTRDGRKCHDCGRVTDYPEVHHTTYDRKGFEWLEDLITLCDECHSKRHNKPGRFDAWRKAGSP